MNYGMLTSFSNIMYLKHDSKHPFEDFKDEIDALRQQTSELASQPPTLSDTHEHNQLLVLARDTLSDGETIYTQSIAGGSISGDHSEATPEREASVFAWLHRQVFETSQSSLPLLTGDDVSTRSKESGHDLSKDMSQSRSDQTSRPEGKAEVDHELDFERSMAKALLDTARTSFHEESYQDSRLRLQAAIATIRDLPSDARQSYDFFDLQYLLSVATFYTTERKNSQSILTDFVRQQATGDEQRLRIAHASQLLAETYIELGNLEAAKSSCANALRIRHCLTNSDQRSKDQCYALAARIETLLGNLHKADALIYYIGSKDLEALTDQYSNLNVTRTLSTKQRHTLYIEEERLFQGYSVDKDTGKLEEVSGQAAQESRSKTMMTLLHFAAIFRDVEHASALIASGADVNAIAAKIPTDDSSCFRGRDLTPLICALLARHENMARLLVSKGANCMLPGTTQDFAVSLLCHVPYKFDQPATVGSMIRCMKHLSWDINSVFDSDGHTLLHNAAETHDIGLVELLMSLDASPLVRDKEGCIPLQIALDSKSHVNRRQGTLDALLQRSSREQLDSQDNNGRAALHSVFCQDGMNSKTADELAGYFIARGANVLLKDSNGNIPLNLAIRNSIYSDLRILLRIRSKEQLCSRNAAQQTPLCLAMTGGAVTSTTIEQLLRAGADSLDTGDDGKTLAARIRNCKGSEFLWPLLPDETQRQEASKVRADVWQSD